MAALHLSATEIEGCITVRSDPFLDQRGVFMEAWNQMDFGGHPALPTQWPQDNFSVSKQNVLRGLHIQRKDPQGKLVSCFQGAVLDIVLDLRLDSPSFKKWIVERLELGRSLYVPPGCAHGFLALEHDSIVYYKCTTLYDKASDGGVNVLDPKLGIHWLNQYKGKFIMSQKDERLPSVDDWLAG